LVLLSCVAALLGCGSQSASDTALPTTVSGRYVIGGIQAMVRVGRAVYVGGEFGRIANRTGSGIVVSAKSGEMERVRAEIAGGPVNAVVADGAGGWYVGGSFTTVGGVHRSGLAHVLVDGRLDPVFAPPAVGDIRRLTLAGNILVAAAARHDGKAEARALDRTTGATRRIVYARPQGAGTVRVLLASGDRVFIGFGNRRLAAYDVARGTRFWTRRFCESSPCVPARSSRSTSGGLIALAVDRDKLIVGGGFAQGRSKNLVALGTANGALTGHPLRSGSPVVSIAAVNGTAYVARDRGGLAVVDFASGRLRDWSRIAGNNLATDGTNLYMNGELGLYAARAGTAQARFRRVSPPIAGGGVLALAPQSGRVFVGGDFTGAGGPARQNLAAFDATSGKLLPWAPRAGPVSAMAASGQTIYIGLTHLDPKGDRVEGELRTGLAAVSAGGKERLLPWRPRLSYWGINALAVGAGRVFVGGVMLFPGSKRAPFTILAAFSARGTGARVRFSPKLGEEFEVGALTVWHHTFIAGGQSVVAYSADGDGRHELWRRPTDAYVSAFLTRGATLYVGGNFDRVDRRPRHNLAAFALDQRGAPLPFAPKVPIGVEALAPFGSDIVFGGEGEETYGKVHQVLGAVNADGKLEPWRVDVAADGINVEHIVPIRGGLLVAGVFSWLGPEGHQAAGGIAWLH
jgi:hypothetical protein